MSKRHLFSRSRISSLEGKLPADGCVNLDSTTRIEVTVNGRRPVSSVPIVSRDQITLVLENGGLIGLRFVEAKPTGEPPQETR